MVLIKMDLKHIEMILFVCYAMYGAVALGCLGIGGVYLQSAGQVGEIAVVMFMFGFILLICAAIGTWNIKRRNWMVLLVLELITVVMYVLLFVVMVCAFFLASGTGDPVRVAVGEGWRLGARDKFEQEDFCQNQGGLACQVFYATLREADTCTVAKTIELQNTYAANCTKFKKENFKVSEASLKTEYMKMKEIAQCTSFENLCWECDKSCLNEVVDLAKEAMTPACLFCLFMVMCTMVVVFWNELLLAEEDTLEEIPFESRNISYCFDIMIFAAGVGLVIAGVTGLNATAQACGDSNCSTLIPKIIMFMGFLIMLTAGVGFAAVMMGKHMYLRVANLVLVILGFALLLLGIFIGISSGTIMGDITSGYETNYGKIRKQLEEIEPLYCSMDKEACFRITGSYDTSEKGKIPMAAGSDIMYDEDALWLVQLTQLQTLEFTQKDENEWPFKTCERDMVCSSCEILKKTIALNIDMKENTDKKEATVLSWGDGTGTDAIMAAKGHNNPCKNQEAGLKTGYTMAKNKSLYIQWSSMSKMLTPCELTGAMGTSACERTYPNNTNNDCRTKTRVAQMLMDIPSTRTVLTKINTKSGMVDANSTGVYHNVSTWPQMLNARSRMHVQTREALAECERSLFAYSKTKFCQACSGEKNCVGCKSCGKVQLHRNYLGEGVKSLQINSSTTAYNPIEEQKKCLTFMRDHILESATPAAGSPYASKCHESCRAKFKDRANFDKAAETLPNFCRMPDETCKAKIRADMEANADTISKVLVSVEFLLLFVLFWSQKAIKMWAKLKIMHLTNDDGTAEDVSDHAKMMGLLI